MLSKLDMLAEKELPPGSHDAEEKPRVETQGGASGLIGVSMLCW